MKVVFRCDASLDIGTGHVMRCLTLADALAARGARCTFISRQYPGHLLTTVAQRGHRVLALAPPVECRAPEPGDPAHAAWLGADWEADAAETCHLLGDERADWLVTDQYALDRRWEQAMRGHCQRIMVIDDLADRPHDCDLLLDQNLGRKDSDYNPLLPEACTRLIGAQFALLRPEFGAHRADSLQRRMRRRCEHLLVSMGGVDKDNTTCGVLKALTSMHLNASVAITVVLGEKAPWLDEVRAVAGAMIQPTKVLAGVSNMAQLMAESDLAVGAAGGTSWERCCLGLPSVLLVIAENQKGGATALRDAGAVLLAATFEEVAGHVQSLCGTTDDAGDLLLEMGVAAKLVTDGEGTERVAERLLSAVRPSPLARRMRESDLAQVLGWRNDTNVRRYMLTQHEISTEEHREWFLRASQDSSRCLLVVEEGGIALGFVQFTNISPQATADWGFYAAPGSGKGSGRKLATAALDHAFGVLQLHKVCGQALASNEASVAFHLALGFQQEGLFREQHFIEGAWQNLVCFGLLAPEWKSNGKI